MMRALPIRTLFAAAIGSLARVLLLAGIQAGSAQTLVVLDRVVAVVNRQAILSSDIDEEIRLSVLDPSRSGDTVYTRQ